MGNHRNAFWGQKFCYGEGIVTWCIVMMEQPFLCSVWSHVNDPFSEPFKDGFLKNWLTAWPVGTNSLWTIPLLSKKTNQHSSDFRFICSFELSLVEESLECDAHHFYHLVLGSYSSPVITRLKEILLISDSRQLFFRVFFCSIGRVFGTILAQTFAFANVHSDFDER